jgi:hypothetical protein
MALTVATQIHGDVIVLRCRGRIVFGDEGAVFRERVRSGLGILVGLHIAAKNRGGHIRLVSPSQHVQRVLGETKLNTVFSIYKTLDEALVAFSGKGA